MSSSMERFYDSLEPQKKVIQTPSRLPQMNTETRVELINLLKDYRYRNPEVSPEQILQVVDDFLNTVWIR